MPHLVDVFNRRLETDASRKARDPNVGSNLPNSVADVHLTPPSGWEDSLRVINPISPLHSWLRFYYYRTADRWVLYDCMPADLIPPDQPIHPGLMGHELLALLRGDAPRDRPSGQRTPWVSDAQHEMHRLHRVYAVPFWVLQGDTGGHQVAFDPQQRMHLTEMGLPTSPPTVGALPGCPFDGRVIAQLNRLNRLAALKGDVAKLRASGTAEAWDVQQALAEQEIRKVSLEMLEHQLGETTEMVQTLGHRKDTRDEVIHRPGEAAKASEALAAYIETGDFIM